MQNHFRCTSMHAKQQTCMLLIISWYSGGNCTELVLKPLGARYSLSFSVLCIAPFQWNKLVLEKSSSAAVYTLPNTIIYLKTIKHSNIRLRQIYWNDLELKIRMSKIEDWMLVYGCKDSGLLCWKLKMLW